MRTSRERKFQSLGRDSVGWDFLTRLIVLGSYRVSIPRSGFCGVGHSSCLLSAASRKGFNPSVGILWGGTPWRPFVSLLWVWFQSLGRDSVGWDLEVACGIACCQVVSIPRSGFCGVGHGKPRQSVLEYHWVSIPRSGFCGVGRQLIHHRDRDGLQVSIPRSGFCGVGL